MNEDSGSGEEDSSSRGSSIQRDPRAPQGLVLDRASVEDIPVVMRIYRESIEYLDEEDEEWVRGVVESRSRRVVLYVLRAPDVVGFAVVYRRGDRAYIDSLAIDPRYRGLGLGKRLLELLEKTLAGYGVRRIFLTVKHGNLRALSLYLRQGYRIRNTVLILGLTRPMEHRERTPEAGDGEVLYKISVLARGRPGRGMIESVSWSMVTGDADEVVYRRSRERRLVLSIYREERLAGVAVVSLEKRTALVERLAVSLYRPTQILRQLLDRVCELLDILGYRDVKEVVVPIDSSKTSLLTTLLEYGFRIIDSEYLVTKDVSREAAVPLQRQSVFPRRAL